MYSKIRLWSLISEQAILNISDAQYYIYSYQVQLMLMWRGIICKINYQHSNVLSSRAVRQDVTIKEVFLGLIIVKLERYNVSKVLVVTIAANMKLSQHSKDAAGKANRMLGFINRNISFKNKDIILPLYNISLVRPHLEYAVQFWSPHYTKDSKIRSCPA